MSLANFIDHTVLKQTTTNSDIDTVCKEAIENGFKAVCIPPVYVSYAARKLEESNVALATVVGFPFGYHSVEAKVAEAEAAIRNGAGELDVVMNLTALKNSDEEYLRREIYSILEKSRKQQVLVKVIIESGILSQEEIIRCCRLYREFEVDFLKTSTGFAEKGASVEAVKLMRAELPAHIQVKASGGIRTSEFARKLVEAGATRLGCSASVAIVKGETGSGSY